MSAHWHARDAISPVSERSTRRTAYPHDRQNEADTLVPRLLCRTRIETRQCHVCEHRARSAARIMHMGRKPRGMRRRGGRSASLGPSPERGPPDASRGARCPLARTHPCPSEEGAARAYTKVRSSKLVAPLLHRVDAGLRSFSTKSRGLGVFSRASSSDPASKRWDWYVS